MPSFVPYHIGDEQLILTGERTLFWESQRTLVIADLHVGKTGHFRKEGINIPQSVYKDDLHRLLAQLLFFRAEKLVIAGDLTHSVENSEMDLFKKWRHDFPSLEVHLAKGNHDILKEDWYKKAGIIVHHEPLSVGPFLFVHDITDWKDDRPAEQYIFSGHVHPAVSMAGKAKQSLRLPCFYFTKQYCILPAFSRFTGGYRVMPRKGDNVFAIAGKEILSFRDLQ
ncbi:MAG: ligase-associated DNA damage response endonuclease PdeM [Chitinophagaceae bacterium]